MPQSKISYTLFKESETLLAFALRGLAAETGLLSLLKRGAVRLEIRFKDATTKAYKAVVFGQFDNLITIDNARIVTLDY